MTDQLLCKIDDLKQSLATQETRNVSINAEFNTLRDDYRALTADYNALQSSYDALRATKGGLESEITNLTGIVKHALHMIDMEAKKMRVLQDENNSRRARIETLEHELAASENTVEDLQLDLAILKASHANCNCNRVLEAEQRYAGLMCILLSNN